GPELKVERSETRVSVNTGMLRFDVDGGTFRGLEYVRVPGKEGETGWRMVAQSSPDGSLYALDADGKRYSSLWGSVRKFEVEEAGPVACRIRVEGTLASEQG